MSADYCRHLLLLFTGDPSPLSSRQRAVRHFARDRKNFSVLSLICRLWILDFTLTRDRISCLCRIYAHDARSIFIFSTHQAFADNSGRPQAVRATVGENLGAVKGCYTDAAKRNPNLAGKVILEWDVDDTGAVKRAIVKSSTLNDSATEACMIEKLKATRFTPAPKGVTTNITYPFVFARANP